MKSRIIAALALLPLLGACAAQPSKPVVVKTDPAPAPQNAVANLAAFTLADLQSADADAVANNDQAAHVCYGFLITSLPTIANFSPTQPIGAVLAFQKARDAINGATAQSGFLKQVNLNCAALANDVTATLVKLGIIASGTAATGGVLAPLVPVIGTVLP